MHNKDVKRFVKTVDMDLWRNMDLNMSITAHKRPQFVDTFCTMMCVQPVMFYHQVCFS